MCQIQNWRSISGNMGSAGKCFCSRCAFLDHRKNGNPFCIKFNVEPVLERKSVCGGKYKALKKANRKFKPEQTGDRAGESKSQIVMTREELFAWINSKLNKHGNGLS